MATVVATWRSAPRPPGSVMLVGPDGCVVGGVCGGCVEGAVYESATRVTADEPVLQRYGVSDPDAFAVGLTCGGTVDIFIERVDRATFPQLGAVAEAIRTGTPVAVVTCLATDAAIGPGVGTDAAIGPGVGTDAAIAPGVGADAAVGGLPGRRLVVWADRVDGTLGTAALDAAATDEARDMLAAGRSGTRRYGGEGDRHSEGLTLFVAGYAPPPRMIIFGATDVGAAVARLGAFLGYHVTVCDARPVFATHRRLPDAAEVVVEWPHRYLTGEAAAGRLDGRTVVCALTHDPKFDGPLLTVALRLPLAYVGAMGSRRAQSDRLARLRAAHVDEATLGRLFGPVGLDLGARTPEETAVSIVAEIIAARSGGSGARLTDTDGRIHHEPVT
ncbi:MAG: xanthine dehydrogenase accessory factor [Micromonosporaceae bacterium]|nr:xanthine dehydrogenase accessory factor [Micromonosporaceae bacterium]